MMNKENQNSKEIEFLYKEEGYQILGACFEVYKELGNGFLESVYQECLAIEFEKNGIPFEQHPQLRIKYREQTISKYFMPDFICFNKIIIELKTASKLSNENKSQLFNYLKITGLKVGYLVNFGHYPYLEFERLVK